MSDRDQIPPEPLSELAESAASLHEFTDWQALRLLGVMLAEQGRQS